MGAFSGGKLMAMGRRKALILTGLIGIFGVGLTLIENFYVLIFGRVIWGFAAGSHGAVIIRMIDEYMPARLASSCVGVYAMAELGLFYCPVWRLNPSPRRPDGATTGQPVVEADICVPGFSVHHNGPRISFLHAVRQCEVLRGARRQNAGY